MDRIIIKICNNAVALFLFFFFFFYSKRKKEKGRNQCIGMTSYPKKRVSVRLRLTIFICVFFNWYEF